MSAEFELNFYYGIHFGNKHADKIFDILHAKYHSLKGDNGKVKVAEYTILPSTNSDFGDEEIHFVMVDEMTQGSDYTDDAVMLYHAFEPSTLVKLEDDANLAVMYMTDMYDYLVGEMKKAKIPVKEARLGWFSVVCKWEAGSESESESEEKPAKATKTATVKKPAKATKTNSTSVTSVTGNNTNVTDSAEPAQEPKPKAKRAPAKKAAQEPQTVVETPTVEESQTTPKKTRATKAKK